MNITFLIGNGFDRNLGLDTTYSDFVNHYKKIEQKTEVLKKFCDYIKDNESLWSNAEIEIGEYTEEFEKGSAEAFSECYIDFCKQLALYLKTQMGRMDYDESQEKILDAFSNINRISQSFPTQEREAINSLYKKRQSEQIVFNFVCFNYTDTLDQCVALVKKMPNFLGSHKFANKVMNHSINQICHVHGTVDKEMVFGVNDESQIAKLDVFECEDGDLYKNTLIKIQANASFLENTDEKATRILKNSDLVYIYGMSIGETDKLWWERVCTWLYASGERHLIIQKYDMPVKTVIQVPYQLAERKAKRNILRYSYLDDTKKTNMETRIHITSENIFSNMKDIAKDIDYKSNRWLTVLEQIKSENKELG